MLVRDRDQIDFLDLAQIYHSALPLFPEEMERWDEPGYIDIDGDDHGAFVFAILTGPMYNAFRAEALSGDAPFEVVALRTPPDATLLNPDGSIDFDVPQGLRMFRVGGVDALLRGPNAGPILGTSFVAQHSRLLRRQRPPLQSRQNVTNSATQTTGESQPSTKRSASYRTRKSTDRVTEKPQESIAYVPYGHRWTRTPP